jgi:hypothetical protein
MRDKLNIDLNIDHYLKSFSKSECHKNIFSEEECEKLIRFMFKGTSKRRLGNSGNIFFSGNFDFIISTFYEKLKNLVDLDDVVALRGNFFITPHQYGFHSDMPEEEDLGFCSGDYAYKSILIPLFLRPVDSDCHLVTFNERLIDYGTTLDNGPSKSESHYNSIEDYHHLKNLYDISGKQIDYKEYRFDDEVFNQLDLGRTSPIERFSGFSVENIFPWCPGDVIVFDTAQLHCSNLGINKKRFKNKCALRISLIKNSLNERDPIDWKKIKSKMATAMGGLLA